MLNSLEITVIPVVNCSFSHLDHTTSQKILLFQSQKEKGSTTYNECESAPQSLVCPKEQRRRQHLRFVDNLSENRPRSARFVKQIFQRGKVAMVIVCHLSMGWNGQYLFAVVRGLFLVYLP